MFGVFGFGVSTQLLPTLLTLARREGGFGTDMLLPLDDLAVAFR